MSFFNSIQLDFVFIALVFPPETNRFFKENYPKNSKTVQFRFVTDISEEASREQAAISIVTIGQFANKMNGRF